MITAPKTTAVVICPGRGTYNAAELGYLARHFPDAALLARFDDQRAAKCQTLLGELDGARHFTLSTHSRGDNASALIFASSYGDFTAIDRDRIDIVGVTGNSMGWYTALACAGALTPEAGFHVANTMGTLMQQALIGGQTIYPWIDEDWVPRPERKAGLLRLLARIAAEPGHELHLSIDLGGMLVLAGNEAGLKAFEGAVEPAQGRFPLRLGNHAAFHTPMQAQVAAEGQGLLPAELFGQPHVPMIDGRGAIWWPGACDPQALHAYTFGTQVTETYNFTRAIAVAAREFAPDLFIILGPGTTLGGAVAQSLIVAGWRGMADKAGFHAEQKRTALLAAMGTPDQRALVLSA